MPFSFPSRRRLATNPDDAAPLTKAENRKTAELMARRYKVPGYAGYGDTLLNPQFEAEHCKHMKAFKRGISKVSP